MVLALPIFLLVNLFFIKGVVIVLSLMEIAIWCEILLLLTYIIFNNPKDSGQVNVLAIQFHIRVKLHGLQKKFCTNILSPSFILVFFDNSAVRNRRALPGQRRALASCTL